MSATMSTNSSNSDSSQTKIASPNTNIEIVEKIGDSKHPVFLAYDQKEDKPCVAKVFTGKDQLAKTTFENEKQFIDIEHPNVVNIEDSAENITLVEDGVEYKASLTFMEYAPYGDFFEVKIKKGISFNEKMTRTYFHQLIDGLEAIHKTGMAHLDIKLDNLLLGENYTLKITDFDMSYSPESSVGNISRGTVNYRAPELRKGKAKNYQACDVYSAGIILFALYTGTYPFVEHGENVKPQEPIYKLYLVLDKYPNEFWKRHSVLQKRPDSEWPADFKDLFYGMCRYEPEKRLTLEEVKSSKWYKGPVYSQEKIEQVMDEHFEGSNSN